MKKSFYFALALTAGLFASCSSDEIAQAPQASLEINDNEAAPIQIGIKGATASVTRGTGTVGALADAAVADNVWAGQKFNLFMFEKGKFIPALKDAADPTSFIYNNAEMSTALDGSNGISYVLNDVEQFNYYPTTGAYQFWAYRIDDAKDPAVATDGVPVGVATEAGGTWTDNATEVTVPFTIDGSQDIMTAIPDEAADLTDLQNVPGASAATADKIYTAYSSRRGITPKLNFKHLLTRLTFQVKAASVEVSDAATAIAGVPAPADGGYNGFKVTGISVKSPATGEIIAAYKDGSNYTEQGVTFNDTWATVANHVGMELKSRQGEVTTKQAGKFSAAKVVAAIAADGTVTMQTAAFVWNGEATGGNATVGTIVYEDNTEDAYTGVPNTKSATLTALANDYKATHEDPNNVGQYIAGTVEGYVYTKTTDLVQSANGKANAPLKELTPVIPRWNAAATVDAYDYVEGYKSHYDAAAAAAAANVSDFEVAAAKNTFDLALDAFVNDAGYTAPVAADENKVVRFFIDGDANHAYDEGETIVGYALVKKTAAEAVGAAVTNVGEALFIAPNAPELDLTITYKRWKKTAAGVVNEIEGTVNKTVKRNAAPGSVAPNFNGGKSYNIVITLYKDGDATTDTTITPWDQEEVIDVEGEE